MNAIPMVVSGPRVGHGKLGLKNGEKITLRCSNCNKGLCCLWVVRPDATDAQGKPFVWTVQATCAYGCKLPDGQPQMSLPREVRGLFQNGGYGVDNPDDPDDSDMKTNVVEIVTGEDGLITYVTAKAA